MRAFALPDALKDPISSQPEASKLPTLSSYLKATHELLSMILQIPPVDPSSSLRTTFLLRLSGDLLGAIPGYEPDTEVLSELLNCLDELDRGWLAVLRSQAWDAAAHAGVDLPVDSALPGRGPNPTERTRLRSLIIGGVDRLEEWLERLDTGGEDFTVALERLGVQRGFDDLFARTLAEMGSLAGTAVNDPIGMVGTC